WMLTSASAAPLGVACLFSMPIFFRVGRSLAAAGLLGLLAGATALARGFGAFIMVETGRVTGYGSVTIDRSPFVQPSGVVALAFGVVFAIWVLISAIAIRRTDLRTLQ